MDSPFDIFYAEPGGTLLWKGAVATLEEARARVKQLVEVSPADYVIVNLRKGLRITIPMPDGNGSGPAAEA